MEAKSCPLVDGTPAIFTLSTLKWLGAEYNARVWGMPVQQTIGIRSLSMMSNVVRRRHRANLQFGEPLRMETVHVVKACNF